MKIALLDLNHMTRGVHTNTVPLGIGLISRYLQGTIKSDFEIKMFKEPNEALAILTSWQPDVLGLAQYLWNSELNLYFAKLIKKINPKCLVIAGGPNLDLSESQRITYLKNHPFIDICVAYDGEIPFAEIIKRLLSGESKAGICGNPVAGSYSFDTESGKIIASALTPPRLKTLDVFGSIYADGFFDEFLDQGFHPFLQTHRGCPFTCAFCHTSDSYYSRMLFLSPDIFRKDLEYLGKRFAGRHDVTLYLANTNMSLFREDFAIAKIIREVKEKYDWPRIIGVNSGKDPKKLLEMLSIINFQPGIALQTLTPKVLENIKRKNISFADYISFQHEILEKTGETSSTELILGLPGETKETFLETLKTVLNSGVQDICVYTLMNLKGTLLSSEEYASRYGYLTRHRVVPRQFSIVQGEKILDTEEVIVGTNTLSFDDYLDLRGLCFTITIFFSSTELIPLKRFLLESGVDLAQWIFSIHNRLVEFPEIKSSFEAFISETRNELFLSREDLLEYFNKADNFEALRSGKLGDNLLRKYKCLVISNNFKVFLDLAVAEAKKLLTKKLGEKEADDILSDLVKFISTRDVKRALEDPNLIVNQKVYLNYDIPSWFSTSGNKSLLREFHGFFEYSVNSDESIGKKARDFVKMNKEHDLSLQILYRDGSIRYFWPKWILINNQINQLPVDRISPIKK